jgi:hypothetical protein
MKFYDLVDNVSLDFFSFKDLDLSDNCLAAGLCSRRVRLHGCLGTIIAWTVY